MVGFYLCDKKRDMIRFFTRFVATYGYDSPKEFFLSVAPSFKLLEADGWVKLKGSGGDHRQFKHPTKKGRVTVRGHESEVLSQFLLNSIWKQAGWK